MAMTPDQFIAIRAGLGLSQAQLAKMLGFGSQPRVAEIEAERRPISRPIERLMRAYLSGYRPEDWPS